MSKKVLLIMLVLLVGLFITGCGNTEEKPAATEEKPAATEEKPAAVGDEKTETITLRYASFIPPGTFIDLAIDEFAKQVEDRTGGRVKVDNYPGGTLLPAPNMYDGVLQGMADIGYGMPGMEPGRFQLLSLLELPHGYQNSIIATSVNNDLLREFEHEFLKEFKVINFIATGPLVIMTQPKVENLQNLQGVEIRSAGAITDSLAALGAAPIAMGVPEMAEALETGIIKGLITQKSSIMDLNWAGYVDYITNYPLASGLHLAVMDLAVWEKLPADVQQVIEEVALEMTNGLINHMDDFDQEALEWMKEQGVVEIDLSPEEKAKWDAKVQPVIDRKVAELEAQGLPASQFIKRLHELKEKYEKDFS